MTGLTQTNMEEIEELTPKQKAVVDEFYSNGQVASRAYLAVYKCNKASTARVQGPKIIALPAAQAYLEHLRNETAKAQQIRLESLIQKLNKLTQSDNDFVVLKALDQLAKLAGFYAPQPQTSIMTNGPVKIDFGGYNFEQMDTKQNKFDESNISTPDNLTYEETTDSDDNK